MVVRQFLLPYLTFFYINQTTTVKYCVIVLDGSYQLLSRLFRCTGFSTVTPVGGSLSPRRCFQCWLSSSLSLHKVSALPLVAVGSLLACHLAHLNTSVSSVTSRWFSLSASHQRYTHLWTLMSVAEGG